MAMKCFELISKDDFGNLTYDTLVEKIYEIPTTTIRELRYSDLYQRRNSCHGIYIIKSPENKYYFGKAIGRCMADRIGGHFDSRTGSFLNSLLGKLACDNTDDSLHNAYIQILDWEFSALFVEGEENEELKKLIGFAEQMLIYHFNKDNKCFNGCNRKRPYDNLEQSLSKLIEL